MGAPGDPGRPSAGAGASGGRDRATRGPAAGADAGADAELARLWRHLTGLPVAPAVRLEGAGVPLPTRYRVADAAAVAVGLTLASAARLEAAGGEPAPVRLPCRAAVEVFRAEQHLRVDGAALASWDPLAGNYPTADGWVRLHTNYAHHRRAALGALGLPDGADRAQVAAAVADRRAGAVEDAVQRAGGAAAALRTPQEWREHPQAAAVAARPLLALGPLTPAGPAGTPGGRRLRVLDLTRVIAAPTAAKVLAALGADVLRLDAPGFEEVPALVPETTAGKRCARLDLRAAAGRAAFAELLRSADVLICGLRPGALAGLGWAPEQLAREQPGLVLAELSAYGDTGPWAGRRGFDSLVQLVTGIAAVDGPGAPPRALPLQALDHASGWLLAAGVLEAVRRQRSDGAGRRVGVVLARTATWLQGLGRLPEPPPGSAAPGEPLSAEALAGEPVTEQVDSGFGRVTRVRFPGTIGARRPEWAGPPSPLGSHPARW